MTTTSFPQRQPTRTGEKIDFQVKLKRGLCLLEAADGDLDMLGCALLALHGALEDYFRVRLDEHPKVLPAKGVKLANRGRCQWPQLLELARTYAGLREDEDLQIYKANGFRAGFAHGAPLWCDSAFVASYARFVQGFIEHDRLTAGSCVREEGAPYPSLFPGEVELYAWEVELIGSLEDAGWQRVNAYTHQANRVRLARPGAAALSQSPSGQSAAKLVNYIGLLEDFKVTPRVATYDHMGAVIADAALQARWDYKKLVRPRVKAVRAALEGQPTTSDFLALLTPGRAERALQVKGAKAEIAIAITTLLVAEGVETEKQLSAWVTAPESRERLMQIKGVGPKTADYLALLAGARDAVAVDVHVRRFLAKAGVEAQGYDDAAATVVGAAKLLGEDPADLEGAIWRYQRRQPKGKRRSN